MTAISEYIEELVEAVGSRPAGSEKEFQAAEMIAARLEDFGLGASIEEFDCHPLASFIPLIGSALVFAGAVLGYFAPLLRIVALLVVLLGLALVVLDTFNINPLLRFLPSKISQNVVARYEPTGSMGSGRPRKVIILAHYDTGKNALAAKSIIANNLRMLTLILRISLVAAFLMSILMALPLPIIVHSIAGIILLACAAFNLIAFLAGLIERFRPEQNGVNCNASGVGVLYQLAEKLAAQGQMSSRSNYQKRSVRSRSGQSRNADATAVASEGRAPRGVSARADASSRGVSPAITNSSGASLEQEQNQGVDDDSATAQARVSHTSVASPYQASLSGIPLAQAAPNGSAFGADVTVGSEKVNVVDTQPVTVSPTAPFVPGSSIADNLVQVGSERASVFVTPRDETLSAASAALANAQLEEGESADGLDDAPDESADAQVPAWYAEAKKKAEQKNERRQRQDDSTTVVRSRYADIPTTDEEMLERLPSLDEAASKIFQFRTEGVKTATPAADAGSRAKPAADAGAAAPAPAGVTPAAAGATPAEVGSAAAPASAGVTPAADTPADVGSAAALAPAGATPAEVGSAAAPAPAGATPAGATPAGATPAGASLISEADSLKDAAMEKLAQGLPQVSEPPTKESLAEASELPTQESLPEPERTMSQTAKRSRLPEPDLSGLDRQAFQVISPDAGETKPLILPEHDESQTSPLPLPLPTSLSPAQNNAQNSAQNNKQSNAQNNAKARLFDLPEVIPVYAGDQPAQQPALAGPEVTSENLFADIESPISSTGSFIPLGSTGIMKPVGEELLAYHSAEELFVADAADEAGSSAPHYTEAGTYADPELVQIKKSSPMRNFLGNIGDKLSGRHKREAEESASEWLGVDTDFDARKEGESIGSWDNFDDDDGNDAWRGGAYGGESFTADAEAMAQLSEELLDKEVWLVATGSGELGHEGVRNLLKRHDRQIKGALFINVLGVGAGDLCFTILEGEPTHIRTDQRLQNLISVAAQELSVPIAPRAFTAFDTDATWVLRKSGRALSLIGMGKSLPQNWRNGDNDPARIHTDKINDATDLILETIKNC